MLGFGPFASHKVNASWVSVQELVHTGGLGDDINLVTLEIPVAYDDVTARIPDIWKTYQPKVNPVCRTALANRGGGYQILEPVTMTPLLSATLL